MDNLNGEWNTMTKMYEEKSKASWKADIIKLLTAKGGIAESTIEGYAAQLLSFCELVSDCSGMVPFIVTPASRLPSR